MNASLIYLAAISSGFKALGVWIGVDALSDSGAKLFIVTPEYEKNAYAR